MPQRVRDNSDSLIFPQPISNQSAKIISPDEFDLVRGQVDLGVEF